MKESYPIPMYYRLYKQLKERIMQGYYRDGKLPTEKELCDEFSVSRMTVRKALERLVIEGLIERKKGKGTFIRKVQGEEHLTKLTGFTEEVGENKVKSEVLANKLVRVPPEAKSVFNLPDGSLVVMLKRIRYIDDTPVAVEEAYLNPAVDVRILNILEKDMSKESLYRILRKEIGISLVRADEIIEVAELSSQQAKLLNLKKGKCALLRKRYTYTSDGQCVEYVVSMYRGDKFKFRVSRS